MSADDAARERSENESAGQKQPGSGVGGQEGGVPNARDGVGIGGGTEPNTFEPEEDPDATQQNEKP